MEYFHFFRTLEMVGHESLSKSITLFKIIHNGSLKIKSFATIGHSGLVNFLPLPSGPAVCRELCWLPSGRRLYREVRPETDTDGDHQLTLLPQLPHHLPGGLRCSRPGGEVSP